MSQAERPSPDLSQVVRKLEAVENEVRGIGIALAEIQREVKLASTTLSSNPGTVTPPLNQSRQLESQEAGEIPLSLAPPPNGSPKSGLEAPVSVPPAPEPQISYPAPTAAGTQPPAYSAAAGTQTPPYSATATGPETPPFAAAAAGTQPPAYSAAATGPQTPPYAAAVPSGPTMPPPSGPPAATSLFTPPPPGPPPRPPSDYRSWLLNLDLEALLRWSGVALVAFGAIFFTSTAIERGWISPELQLALAALLGMGLLGAGLRLAPRAKIWADALIGCGAVVLSATAVAAYAAVDLVEPGVALGLCAAATAASVTVSLLAKSAPGAATAGIAAALAPAFAGIFDRDLIVAAFVWYCAVGVAFTLVDIGLRSIYVRLAPSWIAAIVVMGFALAGGPEGRWQIVVATTSLLILAAGLWFGPWAASLGLKPSPIDLISMVFVPFWLWVSVVYVQTVFDEPTAGFLALAIAAGFALIVALTRGIATSTGLVVSTNTVLAQGLGAFGLGVIGLALSLSGDVRLAAFAVLAFSIALLGLRLQDSQIRWVGYGIEIIVLWIVGLMLLDYLADGLGTPLRLIGPAVVIASGWAMTWIAFNTEGPNDRTWNPLASGFGLANWVASLAWAAAAVIDQPQGQALVSVILVVAAVGAIVAGFRLAADPVLWVGIATLLFAIGKLFTVDLATVDPLWRGGLFVLVGLGLLRTGFLLPRLARARNASSVEAGSVEAES